MAQFWLIPETSAQFFSTSAILNLPSACFLHCSIQLLEPTLNSDVEWAKIAANPFVHPFPSRHPVGATCTPISCCIVLHFSLLLSLYPLSFLASKWPLPFPSSDPFHCTPLLPFPSALPWLGWTQHSRRGRRMHSEMSRRKFECLIFFFFFFSFRLFLCIAISGV